jgi:hypothetical protein
MPELPSSWGLRKKKRPDGKLDILGKTDSGEDYKVRTTSGPEVTDSDIKEIAAVDREQTTAREFVKSVIDNQQQIDKQREAEMDSEWTALAEDIVGECTTNTSATRAGEIDLPLKCGMTTAYRKGERYWKEINEWKRRGCPLPEA